MACRTDFTQARIQGIETNWLRPLSPRVILISLITSSSSAVCRSILTSGIIVLSKTTPSVTEMLGGTWEIWIRHLYFPLTFVCRQGLIGFRERSLFLWIIWDVHKGYSEPFGSFCSSMDNKNLLCFTAPSQLFLLFAPKPTSVFSLWCSWPKTQCWVAFKAGWAGNEEPSPTDGPDPELDHFLSPLAQEWVADGLLSLNLNWSTFACFSSQLWPHLSLFLLLDLCRRCCSSRAWGYDLGW